MQSRSSADIDRKLAIYYHPLFQEVIRNILSLFSGTSGEIGLFEFIQFNLKLQKCLLPSFQIENALVSALNDWVKEVAECMSYQGMVSTTKCEEITRQNWSHLIQREYDSLKIVPFAHKDEYMRILSKISTHDAFKLLGVKINRQVFNKFMFDLCSTWCQFLDIELFTYFLLGIYVQISQGKELQKSTFQATLQVQTIDLEFMEQFQQLKKNYSKSKRKQLRYYRAWCEWNYLRINEIGENLIPHLNNFHSEDDRILDLALVFERAIQVINEQITIQHKDTTEEKEIVPGPKEDTELVIKRIQVKKAQESKESGTVAPKKEPSEESIPEDFDHDFEIQIDSEGNMYLKKIVKLPIIGNRINRLEFSEKTNLRMKWLEAKKQSCREVSNLYKRLEKMKIRLEHNTKNDPYAHKRNPKVQARDQFYAEANPPKIDIYSNMQIEKIIHSKPQPDPPEQIQAKYQKEPAMEKEPKEALRVNNDYKYKVMAPPFLTDNSHNISYAKGENYTYGEGVHSQKRDLKIGLPKLKHMQSKLVQLGKSKTKSYHIVGKLTTNRALINQRLKAYSTNQTALESDRIEKEKLEYKHVWNRYIDEAEMKELTNYHKFYKVLQKAKKRFSLDYQSEYRLNLKQIDIYENKRCDMGGVLSDKEQQRFYTRMERIIKKENIKSLKKTRKNKFRQYKKAFKSKHERKVYQDIFLSFHREAIKDIKKERSMIRTK